MAGMWELPPADANDEAPLLTVKHSITNTDYTVRVYEAGHRADHSARTGQGRAVSALRWFAPDKVVQLPLTGLARKILRRAGIIQ
jgi:A/G-specific adenine glycosylase